MKLKDRVAIVTGAASGIGAASARLFEGRPWAVVPLTGSRPDAVDLVIALAETVSAVPSTMRADEHDRAVALVSHVPHLASVLVAQLLNAAPDGALDLAGPGLRGNPAAVVPLPAPRDAAPAGRRGREKFDERYN